MPPWAVLRDLQAVIDAEQRELTIIAPQAQFLGLGGGSSAVGIVAGQDDAVQAVEDLIPGTVADVGHQHRHGFRSRQAGGNTRRPQSAAVPFVAVHLILAVDPDANGRSGTRH